MCRVAGGAGERREGGPEERFVRFFVVRNSRPPARTVGSTLVASPCIARGTAGVLALVLSGGCSLEDALNAHNMSSTAAGSSGGTTTTGQDRATADPADVTGASADSGSTRGGEETGEPMAVCADRPVRVASYNVESVNAAGSASNEALRAVLTRIDADIVCVQEIADGEAVAFGELAAAVGLPHVLKAERSPAIGGELSNGCMARFPIDAVGSWGGQALSTDPTANDVGRDLLAVRMDLSARQDNGAPCHLGLITAHAKSGEEPVDWFRRQVEAVRLAAAVQRYRQAHPQDGLVVLGDFNETLDDPAIGTRFDGAPPDLPNSYSLGADIEFPLEYQPFASVADAGLTLTSPGQEDAPLRRETWRDSLRLDYIWLGGPTWVAGEVYNGCRDDGIDEDPPGDFVVKAGAPLDCSVTEEASDHFAVLADLTLP